MKIHLTTPKEKQFFNLVSGNLKTSVEQSDGWDVKESDIDLELLDLLSNSGIFLIGYPYPDYLRIYLGPNHKLVNTSW